MEPATSRFDRYEILDVLGVGGMGQVVKARALGPHGFEKLVAIKRIRAEWAAQESMGARFIREARIAAQLQHANIVQVFDFGRHADELFIVMEYVEGQSLDDILHRLRGEGKRPTLGQALQIALDVARALNVAHTLEGEEQSDVGVVHRDVSPANVLLSRQGVVKLTDFGIAAWGSQKERTSLVAGKPLYMAPEQLRGDALDGRADLFALGLLLYEMLTGERPWPGLVDASEDASLEEMGYQPPSAWTTGLPEELDALVKRLLSLNAQDRPSARGLMKDLLQIGYANQVVLDPSELVGLVGAKVDQATAPTLPQYESRPETLITQGVSPDGVTLLATDPDAAPRGVSATPRSEMPVATAPASTASTFAEKGPAWIAALALLLLAVVGGLFWLRSTPEPVGGPVASGPREEATLPTRAVDEERSGAAEATAARQDPSDAGTGTEDSGSDPEVAAADPPAARPESPRRAEPGEAGEPEAAGPVETARETIEPAVGPEHTAPTAAQQTGYLNIYARPWAQVFIDGRRFARNAPVPRVPVSAGPHEVRLVNPVLGLTETRQVNVPANGEVGIQVVFGE
ncbi:MAG: protein kinase [Sandaracinaceae bacterium]